MGNNRGQCRRLIDYRFRRNTDAARQSDCSLTARTRLPHDRRARWLHHFLRFQPSDSQPRSRRPMGSGSHQRVLIGFSLPDRCLARTRRCKRGRQINFFNSQPSRLLHCALAARFTRGGMPEWSNGLDSKSSDGLVPSVGSNPTPSARALSNYENPNRLLTRRPPGLQEIKEPHREDITRRCGYGLTHHR